MSVFIVSVYPSLDMEEDPFEFKTRKKLQKDDNWNPKGEQNHLAPKMVE